MRKIRRFFLVFSLFFHVISLQSFGFNIANCPFEFKDFKSKAAYINQPPVAVNDTIIVPVGGTKSTTNYNILANDYDPENNEFVLSFIYAPTVGQIKVDCYGNFTYTTQEGYLGSLTISYIISETANKENRAEAKIFIHVKKDTDYDNIPDDTDIDDDNDGILDYDESLDADTDNDKIPNYLDIDSDNDGIPDNIEKQMENQYILPLLKDSDKDGLDDSYDNDNGGKYLKPVDTDLDGTPDFLDMDSDNDNYYDIFEAKIYESMSEVHLTNDSDLDGLDNNFDSVNGWAKLNNPIGSNVTLPDSDNNGVRNWRDAKTKKPIGGNENALTYNPLNFKIYPNPAYNEFIIELPSNYSEEIIKLEIINLDGKVIYKSFLQNEINRFNSGEIGSSGIFIVRLSTNFKTCIHRLIISK